ncbi:hypothetical protein L873DRAFT_1794721 [Choiromyces venosus 120613-1]|uniref:Uncharacterized protein n=1 Tax=Choiromyces venosus 120613-1 TaxID=1336337 RepID=A0A3N4J354_9PEZI|nr:hypothetical protein L873DRAFT_1794721 [Choiromyces venosus 120613-1]
MCSLPARLTVREAISKVQRIANVLDVDTLEGTGSDSSDNNNSDDDYDNQVEEKIEAEEKGQGGTEGGKEYESTKSPMLMVKAYVVANLLGLPAEYARPRSQQPPQYCKIYEETNSTLSTPYREVGTLGWGQSEVVRSGQTWAPRDNRDADGDM